LKRTRAAAVALGALLASASPAHASGVDRSDCAVDGRYVMGTILQIELCADDAGARTVAIDAAFATARHIEDVLTTFSDESPTVRLNAHAGEGPQPLPPEVVELLASSRSHHARTAGTFDVTVAPLIRLWREAGSEGREPSPDELVAARARVGSEGIALGADGSTAALAGGMAVDFGGIGKGYALDRAAGLLRASGIERALLDFGRSSVVALGGPLDAWAWRLLLEHPARGALGVIALRDRSLSVSGSLAQGAVVGGRRYGHVIDPRSGRPLERDLVAAVVAPEAELAEVLSKALLILGEEAGIALVESVQGAEALLADADGRTWSTRGWSAATSFAPAAPTAGGT